MIFTPFRMQTTLLPPSELRCCHCLRSVCCFLFPRRGAARFRVGVPGCAADRLPLLLPLPPHRLPFSVSSPLSGLIPGRVPGCAADQLPPLLLLPAPSAAFLALAVERPDSGSGCPVGAAARSAVCCLRCESGRNAQIRRSTTGRVFPVFDRNGAGVRPGWGRRSDSAEGAVPGWMARVPRTGPPPAGDSGGFFRVAIPGRRPRSDCTGCPDGSAEPPLVYI